jgi:hypothetical protein
MKYLSILKSLFSLKAIGNRFSVFALVPLMVLSVYAYVFGVGELLVHALAIGQYTLLAFVAYAISNALAAGADSSDAYSKAISSDTGANGMRSAIVFAAVILSRTITFYALAMSYTVFMTSSKSLL